MDTWTHFPSSFKQDFEPLLMKKANPEYEKNFQSKKCVTVGKILMTLSSCSQQVRKSNFQIDTNLTVNTMKYKIIGSFQKKAWPDAALRENK